MYQFRIKKDSDMNKYLDSIKNKNKYIVDLIANDKDKNVLTLSKKSLEKSETFSLNKTFLKKPEFPANTRDTNIFTML